jgi:hypothetical protein
VVEFVAVGDLHLRFVCRRMTDRGRRLRLAQLSGAVSGCRDQC